jgi:hypothetical protein
MNELLTRPISEAAQTDAAPINRDEVKGRIRGYWNNLFGAGATAQLSAAGADFTEYSLTFKTVEQRRKACEDLVRELEGFFSAAADRRLRWSICLYHLAKRVPALLQLPAAFARACVEAARVKIDWKFMCDDAPAAYAERFNALLPALQSGELGATDGKADDKLWRSAVFAIVVEGRTVDQYSAELAAARQLAAQPTAQPQPAASSPAPAANTQPPAGAPAPAAQPTAPQFVPAVDGLNVPTAGEGEAAALQLPAADSGLSVQVQFCLNALRHSALPVALAELTDDELAALVERIADEDGRRAAARKAAQPTA